MRIAQLAPLKAEITPESTGDTERHIHYLTEELVRMGHDVSLYASAASRTNAQLHPQSSSAQIDSGWMIRQSLMLEQVSAREKDYDIIHSHLDFFAAPLASRRLTNTVSTIHTPFKLTDESIFREYKDLPLIALSRSQQENPFPWLNWQGIVSPGIPVDSYPLQERRGNYLAYYGAVAPLSGLLTAVEIAARAGVVIKIACPPQGFDSEYYAEIEPVFKRKGVEYLGSLTNQDKQIFLKNALALILPISRGEPFDLTVIESLACGTPLLANSSWLVADILAEGINGYYFQSLNEAVDRVDNIADLERSDCRKIFEKRFTTKSMAREYLAIYKQLCPEK